MCQTQGPGGRWRRRRVSPRCWTLCQLAPVGGHTLAGERVLQNNNNTTRHLLSRVTAHSVAFVLMSSCRPMEVDGAGPSAWRRRQRRLRSWLRHERQTVAMELAAALHHSRDVGPRSHYALRGQNSASSGREGVEVESHRVPPAPEDSTPGDAAGAVGGRSGAAGGAGACGLPAL